MNRIAKTIAEAVKKAAAQKATATAKKITPVGQKRKITPKVKSVKQVNSPKAQTTAATRKAVTPAGIKGNMASTRRQNRSDTPLARPYAPTKFDLQPESLSAAVKNLVDNANMRYVPVTDYKVSSAFGVDRGTHYHAGIDLAVPIGTPVSAAMKGTVSFAGWGNGYGYRVVLDHPDGTQTTYNHLSDIGVTVGEEVSAGHTIALSGNSGNSTGPHLHFEVKTDGQYADPALYFDFEGGATAPQSGEYTSKMGEVAGNNGSTSSTSAASSSSSSSSAGSSGSSSKKRFKTVPKVDFAEVSFTDYFRITDSGSGGRVGGSSRKRKNYFDSTVGQVASPDYRHRGWR